MLSTSDNVDVTREDIQYLLKGLIETVRACDSWETWNLSDDTEWTDGKVSACLKALQKSTETLPEVIPFEEVT